MLQTYLPFPNIYPSVAVLTDKQLCKQRIDARKILDTLQNKSQTYRHHPAVKMWMGHHELLKGYLSGCNSQWTKRGYSNKMESPHTMYSKLCLPLWWGGKIHASHRDRLMWDNPKHFGPLIGDKVPASVFYRDRPRLFWPVKDNGVLR